MSPLIAVRHGHVKCWAHSPEQAAELARAMADRPTRTSPVASLALLSSNVINGAGSAGYPAKSLRDVSVILRRLGDASLANRLSRMNVAFAVTRHLTTAMLEDLEGQVRAALAAGDRVGAALARDHEPDAMDPMVAADPWASAAAQLPQRSRRASSTGGPMVAPRSTSGDKYSKETVKRQDFYIGDGACDGPLYDELQLADAPALKSETRRKVFFATPAPASSPPRTSPTTSLEAVYGAVLGLREDHARRAAQLADEVAVRTSRLKDDIDALSRRCDGDAAQLRAAERVVGELRASGVGFQRALDERIATVARALTRELDGVKRQLGIPVSEASSMHLDPDAPDPVQVADLERYGYPFKFSEEPRKVVAATAAPARVCGFLSQADFCRVRALSMRHAFLPGLGSPTPRAAQQPRARRRRPIGFGSGSAASNFQPPRGARARAAFRGQTPSD